MAKPQSSRVKPIEKRGGYGAGDKLVSELKPPPRGPATGAKPAKPADQNSGSSTQTR